MNRGMASNLAVGNVLSTDEYTIDNFAMHFCPPSSSMSVQAISQSDVLQFDMLSSNNVLSREDTNKA